MALAATAVGVTTTGSLMAHKREAVAAEKELTKYKLDTAKDISEANARAEEARLESAKLQAQVTPRLTDEQFQTLKSMLAGKVRAVTMLHDPSVAVDTFARRIGDALLQAKVSVDPFLKGPPGSYWTGINIQIPENTPASEKDALVEAFTAAKLYSGPPGKLIDHLLDIPLDRPLITIGQFLEYPISPMFSGVQIAKPRPPKQDATK